MFDSTWSAVQTVLGVGAENLNAGQMAVRAIVTFAVTVTIVRLGDKRMFGKGTTFDIIVAIMIGSVMSRAITGSAPLFPTWVAGLVLVGLHWLLALLTFRFDWIGPLVKGNPVVLIKDGEVNQQGVREGSVSRNDLQQALRTQGTEPDPSRVQLAVLERDGSISVIERDTGPHILDVSVADGVQTVRISLK